MVTDLQGSEAAGLTACALEEFLAGRGRAVLRQVLQDHLDLRAAREEQTARQQRTSVVDADGITRTRVETGHCRLRATLFGTVRVTRCAWRRPGAGNLPGWRPGRNRTASGWPPWPASTTPSRRHAARTT